jgi:hypothetical protein
MIDFQEAYSWLYQFDKVDSFLSESAKLYEIPLQQALSENDFSNLDGLIGQILSLAQTSTKVLEIAEIYLLCALVFYVQAEMEKTLQMLDEASPLYKTDPHKYGVVQWLKGCTCWKIKQKQAEALRFWQLSLDTFERQKFQNRMNKQVTDWYRIQCERMRQSFKEVSIDDQP